MAPEAVSLRNDGVTRGQAVEPFAVCPLSDNQRSLVVPTLVQADNPSDDDHLLMRVDFDSD